MFSAGGLLALLVGAIFVVLLVAITDLRHSSSLANRSEQAIVAATNAQKLTVDLETGVRGLLITGEDRFLKPYLAARPRAQRQSEQLQYLVSDDPAQRAAARRLATMVHTYIADYAQPLVIAQQQGQVTLARKVKATAEGAGRFDALRAGFARFVDVERARADRRRRSADEHARSAIVLGVVGLVASVLLVLAFTGYLARAVLAPVRRLVGAARRFAAGDRSARVPEGGGGEVAELGRTFNAMVASLNESERARDEFFALISHELRTPLTSIIGYLDLLSEDGQLDSESERFVAVAQRNAQRLERLVGDLLFLAQFEAGRLTLARDVIDLAALAAESCETARPLAEHSGVKLSCELTGSPHVEGDRDRLGQLVDNLVSNALKFTPSGGHVEVRARAHGDVAEIEVSDSGVGVPADERERLFERFFRASTATSQAVPGVGLGLAIANTIARAHAGRIDVSSVEGEGSTFRITLPLAAPSAASGEQDSPQADDPVAL
ncbi:MAG TPA: ATP-binding protein [Solirubrobacteraceae bacterium]|nr:ATP-binding protein [Solirubrobacteraceae bacterium]